MPRALCGPRGTVLVVIRGGSGETTVARSLRQTYDRRGLALITQDVVRRAGATRPQRSRAWRDGTPQQTVRRFLDAADLPSCQDVPRS
ncbi:hypothetical protein [Nonomuraea sp. NPDC049309]|uniref:hypothetical protein n=1 Tax=Nonomuraea sp. NPDC049309 TaxID=3364350 RepID=UPI0037215C7B